MTLLVCFYMSWVQITHGTILKNVASLNNLLLNLYFENSTIGLYVLYVLNLYTNFHANQMSFTI